MISILIMNLVLVVIAIILLIAEKYLVTYGECKVIVNQENEKKEIIVQGGGYLLPVLTENKINISSSCGGKASCGYCKVKVLSGADQLLPTEEIFMSRQEKLSNMHLACQVKIKKDIEIFIPDFLETVKEIIRKRTYDTKLRWSFKIVNQEASPFEENAPGVKFGAEDRFKLKQVSDAYEQVEEAVVPILQKINKTYNYLPEEVLRHVSKDLNIPLSLIYRTATFYNSFSLVPIGKNVITVCTGTACHVKGAEKVIYALENELGIKRGQTTEDMLFSLKTVRCLGCCGLAPVLKVGEEIHGMMDQNKVVNLIKTYREGAIV